MTNHEANGDIRTTPRKIVGRENVGKLENQVLQIYLSKPEGSLKQMQIDLAEAQARGEQNLPDIGELVAETSTIHLRSADNCPGWACTEGMMDVEDALVLSCADKLEIDAETGKPKFFQVVLYPGMSIQIGRSNPLFEKTLTDFASREHCVVTNLGQGGITIEDLDSSNGTFIEKEPLRTEP
jgi:hypothetical protein